MTPSLHALHAELGIPTDYASRRGLPLCPQAEILMPLGLDALGRDQFATPATVIAWHAMHEAAANQGVMLQLVSAFRSVDYQAAIIRRKLLQGQCIDDILQVSAAPGYSEHHTGCALDITTPDSAMLEASFDATPAFAWLHRHAAGFGFSMSYPPANPYGITYEPWHWAYQPNLTLTATP